MAYLLQLVGHHQDAVRGLLVLFYGPNLRLVASALSRASVGLPVDFRQLQLSVKSSTLVHHFCGLDVASARLPHFRYFRQPLLFTIPSVIGPVLRVSRYHD